LIISLNNTGEPLYLVNRSGNRPSHEGATPQFNSAVDLCLGAPLACYWLSQLEHSKAVNADA